MRVFIVSLGLLCGVLALAAPEGATVPYPEAWRKWVHVKSTLIGPQHSSFASNGGIHHFYANQKALEGYTSDKFPDGSVLIDDLLEVKENAGVTTEGARRRVAVMVKDTARYRDTGGWGFEIFKGDESVPVLDAAGKAACFACHGKQKESVFSKFRK